MKQKESGSIMQQVQFMQPSMGSQGVERDQPKTKEQEREAHRRNLSGAVESARKEIIVKRFDEAIQIAFNALKGSVSFFGQNSMELLPAYFILAEANICVGGPKLKKAEEFLIAAYWNLLKHQNDKAANSGQPMLTDQQFRIYRASLHKLFGRLFTANLKLNMAQDELAKGILLDSEEHGPESPLLCPSYFYMGNVFDIKKQTEAAQCYYSRVAQIWKDFILQQTPIHDLSDLQSHYDNIEFQEAKDYMHRIFQWMDQVHGEESIATIDALISLGLLLLKCETEKPIHEGLMCLQKGYQGYLHLMGQYDPKTKELGELITSVRQGRDLFRLKTLSLLDKNSSSSKKFTETIFDKFKLKMFTGVIEDEFDDFDFLDIKPKSTMPKTKNIQSESVLPKLAKENGGSKEKLKFAKQSGLPTIMKKSSKPQSITRSLAASNNDEEDYDMDDFEQEDNAKGKKKKSHQPVVGMRDSSINRHTLDKRKPAIPAYRSISRSKEKKNSKGSTAGMALSLDPVKSGVLVRMTKKNQDLYEDYNQEFETESPKVKYKGKLLKLKGSAYPDAPMSARKKPTPRKLLGAVASVDDILRTDEGVLKPRGVKSIRQSVAPSQIDRLSVSPQLRPKRIKVGKGNVLQIVEESLKKAKQKLNRLEAAKEKRQRKLSGRGESEYTDLEKQNRLIRLELKKMNENLNLIFENYDFADFNQPSHMQKKQRKQKARLKSSQSDETRNSEKLLNNLVLEYQAVKRQLQRVSDINYQIELLKSIAKIDEKIKQITADKKHLLYAQREREKRMDYMEEHQMAENNARVYDLTSQLTANINRINKVQKQIQRQQQSKHKLNDHVHKLKGVNSNLLQIAGHYGVDISQVYPAKNGSQPNKEKYQGLQKKLRAIESDFERVRLKNRIFDLKKTKRILNGRKQQLELEFKSKEELAHMSHGILLDLIKKLKRTGERSTLDIIEKWEDNNEALLKGKSQPRLMIAGGELLHAQSQKQILSALQMISPITDNPLEQESQRQIKQIVSQKPRLKSKISPERKIQPEAIKPFALNTRDHEPIQEINQIKMKPSLPQQNKAQQQQIQSKPIIGPAKPQYSKPSFIKKPFAKPFGGGKMNIPQKLEQSKSQPILLNKQKGQDEKDEVPFSQLMGIKQDSLIRKKQQSFSRQVAEKEQMSIKPSDYQQINIEKQITTESDIISQEDRKEEKKQKIIPEEIKASPEKNYWNGGSNFEEMPAEVIDFEDLQF